MYQHAEEASFQWLLRDHAVHEPHYTLNDLARLDNRVEAHLDGLRIAGDAGWEICREALSIGEPGEVFAAASLAFSGSNEERINTVLEAVGSQPELARAMVSALGWLRWDAAEPHARSLAASELPLHRYIGLAAYAIHRQNPGPLLTKSLGSNDPLLQARALKAAGELGLTDLLPLVQVSLNNADNPKRRFYAAWSAALLGSSKSLPVLQDIAESGDHYAEKACTLAVRKMPLAAAHAWLRELAHNVQTLRLAVMGTGALGDPASVPWLIQMMEIPEQARVAGESFSLLTGLDLAYEDLEAEWPEGFEAGPTEDPEDENTALDQDEDLPWPAPALVTQWWNANKGRFVSGSRYLAGEPKTVGCFERVLVAGYQRQRAAAAMELALLKPGKPLFEIRKPCFLQEIILHAEATSSA